VDFGGLQRANGVLGRLRFVTHEMKDRINAGETQTDSDRERQHHRKQDRRKNRQLTHFVAPLPSSDAGSTTSITANRVPLT
jgi:hypothetical protein